MLVNTANGLARLGVRITFITEVGANPYAEQLEAPVAIEPLANPHDRNGLETLLAQLAPDVAISAKLEDDRLLVDAADQCPVRPRVVFRVGNPIGFRLREKRGWIRRRSRQLGRLRHLYARADGCIAVSAGIRRDLMVNLKVDPERIFVLPNPTITDATYAAASQPTDHPWLENDSTPVVLAAGGLRAQKDFATLVDAFAILRRSQACRLIVLGDGRQRERLRKRARKAGVDADVDFPGWQSNVHAYMQRACVFALSSRWEGSPNVIVEALALGTPVVATDCPYGPREILQNGRYGRLVRVGNAAEMANALADTMQHPPDPDPIQAAVSVYSVSDSAKAYARALGLSGSATTDNAQS